MGDRNRRPQSDVNPYATPTPLEHSKSSGRNDHHDVLQPRMTQQEVASRRLRGGFLYRQIDISEPLTGILTYTGWWFIQRVYWNDYLVWRKISWWTLERELHFRFPPHSTTAGREGKVEIEFRPGLLVRRFAILCDGVLIYEEGRQVRAYPKRGLTLSGEAKNVMKTTRIQRVRPLFG